MTESQIIEWRKIEAWLIIQREIRRVKREKIRLAFD